MENFSCRHCGGTATLFSMGLDTLSAVFKEEQANIALRVNSCNLYLSFHSSATVWSH